MNRALIVVIIIVSLCIAGIVGYASATHHRPQSVPPEKPSTADGEHSQPPKSPKVFEKDTQGLVSAPMLTQQPDMLESYILKFPLESFNRVEGEVTVTQYRDEGATPAEDACVLALVLDPHGNTILRNAPYISMSNEFPWHFSFIASMSGEHGLLVSTGGIQLMGQTVYVAHLKVTVYEK